jgi:hypothetical protein
MAEHHVVETRDSGTGTGMVLGIALVLLVVVVAALFMILGGPGRFASGASGQPSQTNVNVPAQQQPSGPNINVPRQVDVNVNNQNPAPQAPAQSGGSGR